MHTCEYTIEGNPEGPTLVFIHGWPDNASLWRKQVAALAPDYRCVLVTLPNFGAASVRAGRPSLKAALMILGYQWALVFCWFVGGLIPPLGNLLTKGVARVVRVPQRQRKGVRSRYNYPYFYLWQGMLLPWKRAGILQGYEPRRPVVYLYGTRKPFQFHSKRWLDMVAASGGFARGIDAGHWLQEQRAEEVNAVIRDWLSAGKDDS